MSQQYHCGPRFFRFALISLLFLITTSGSRAATTKTSSVCSFKYGPKAGTTHDYAPRTALPVGSACDDGAGSRGFIILKANHPGGGEGGMNGPEVGSRTSTLCSFNDGPKSGTIDDNAPRPPLPLGSACEDGDGSKGITVAKPPGKKGRADALSSLCSLNNGPRSGTTYEYAPSAPLPIGKSCGDGQGSTGVIVAKKTAPR
jgi:hypothetical protein